MYYSYSLLLVRLVFSVDPGVFGCLNCWVLHKTIDLNDWLVYYLSNNELYICRSINKETSFKHL